MLDRVFSQRLKKHTGHHHIERCRLQLLHDPQFVASETDYFDVEVVIDELQFFAKRYEGVAAAQQSSQNRRQLDDQFARRIGIEAHQRGDRVQGIEQEVRVDLVLQRFHSGLQ